MKVKILNTKEVLWLFALTFFFIFSTPSAYSEEVTIIYTGNSYSSLYPCGHCPSSVGGGVLARASALDNLKKNKKNFIIIDSGNFTASGELDTNSINPELDKKRAETYYQVMEKTGYEVAGIGEAEFSFGKEFLQEQIKKSSIKYISSNLILEGVKPYYIKEFSDFNVGFVALSPKDIYRKYGVVVKDYQQALEEVISQIEGECDLIILIASIGDEAGDIIVEKFPMIKFVFSSGVFLSSKTYEHLGAAVVFKPSYQARELRFVDIDFSKKGDLNWNFSKYKLPLGSKKDDSLKSIVPSCFREQDCPSKEGCSVIECQNPGSPSSSCVYSQAKKINVSVVTDKNCPRCSTEIAESIIKSNIPGVQFTSWHYETEKGEYAIKKYGIKTLPAFIIDSEALETKRFIKLKPFLEKSQDKFLLTNEVGGIFLYLERPVIEKRIDLFLDLYDEKTEGIFASLLDFSLKKGIELVPHFIISDKAKTGYPDEEIKAALAIAKVYPQKYNDYISRRTETIKNVSWVNVLNELGLDYEKIKEVLYSEQINELLEENFRLAKELGVEVGNIILVKNNRIFKIFALSEEGLENLFH